MHLETKDTTSVIDSIGDRLPSPTRRTESSCRSFGKNAPQESVLAGNRRQFNRPRNKWANEPVVVHVPMRRWLYSGQSVELGFKEVCFDHTKAHARQPGAFSVSRGPNSPEKHSALGPTK
jgi:hypothetical protein